MQSIYDHRTCKSSYFKSKRLLNTCNVCTSLSKHVSSVCSTALGTGWNLKIVIVSSCIRRLMYEILGKQWKIEYQGLSDWVKGEISEGQNIHSL